MPGGTLTGPPSPTAVQGSIAGVTSIAEAVDTSEDTCGSEEFGTCNHCGDDTALDVSPTAVEGSIAGAASTAEAVDTSDCPRGSDEFGGSKSSWDRTGWIDDSRPEVVAGADSLSCSTDETSPL